MFVVWLNEGTEHKSAFEKSTLMRIGAYYLRGTWSFIRKVRLVQFLRKLIEQGLLVSGVREMYEEGCKLLSEMERENIGGEERTEEEQKYMYELYLLKVQGIQKHIKEDERMQEVK